MCTIKKKKFGYGAKSMNRSYEIMVFLGWRSSFIKICKHERSVLKMYPPTCQGKSLVFSSPSSFTDMIYYYMEYLEKESEHSLVPAVGWVSGIYYLNLIH